MTTMQMEHNKSNIIGYKEPDTPCSSKTTAPGDPAMKGGTAQNGDANAWPQSFFSAGNTDLFRNIFLLSGNTA